MRLICGINEFKRGYQPTTNLVEDNSSELFADLYNNLNRWKNYFLQVLSVCDVKDVRQTRNAYN
jgi:hypothetical protein